VRKKTGETVNLIRVNKGYSQKYVSGDALTQGAFSKFEKFNTDIRLAAFEQIIINLVISYDEFHYIQNGYKYDQRDQMINRLLGLTYNDIQALQSLMKETKDYLKKHDDIIILDVKSICESLILLRETNNIEIARTPLLSVWNRLSKRNLLYIVDIYFVNLILFLFPLETALEIKKFAFRSIDLYRNFQDVERLKINILVNISLLLIKENCFEDALAETEQAISLCKKFSDYLRLPICYIRKGICINKMKGNGDEWIEKGRDILTAIDELALLKILDDEIARHVRE